MWQFILDTLAARIYVGSAPIFIFSVVIYTAQGLYSIWAFRRLGLPRAVGFACITLLATYSAYELAFKLSFLLFGFERVTYFLNYELYPTALLLVGVATILAVDNIRAFKLPVGITSVLWIAWLVTSFPVDVRAYELKPDGLPLVFNFVTKLSLSLAASASICRS